MDVDVLLTFMKGLELELYLENHNSVARDHLANERTFLAWMRTGLTAVSAGVVVTQLFQLNGHVGRMGEFQRAGQIIGILFIVIGLIFSIIGTLRYFSTQKALLCGLYPAARISIIVAFIVIIALITSCLSILIKNETKIS